MALKGSVDFPCGTYTYELIAPTVKEAPPLPIPILGEQHCFGVEEFGKHKTAKLEDQNTYAERACENFNSTFPPTIPDDQAWRSLYHYIIRWEKDCVATTPTPAILTPLSADPSITCYKLMTENFSKCKSTVPHANSI